MTRPVMYTCNGVTIDARNLLEAATFFGRQIAIKTYGDDYRVALASLVMTSAGYHIATYRVGDVVFDISEV